MAKLIGSSRINDDISPPLNAGQISHKIPSPLLVVWQHAYWSYSLPLYTVSFSCEVMGKSAQAMYRTYLDSKDGQDGTITTALQPGSACVDVYSKTWP